MKLPLWASITNVAFISGDSIVIPHCILLNNSFQNPDFGKRFTIIFSSGIPSSPSNQIVPHSSDGFNKYCSVLIKASSTLSMGDL